MFAFSVSAPRLLRAACPAVTPARPRLPVAAGLLVGASEARASARGARRQAPRRRSSAARGRALLPRARDARRTASSAALDGCAPRRAARPSWCADDGTTTPRACHARRVRTPRNPLSRCALSKQTQLGRSWRLVDGELGSTVAAVGAPANCCSAATEAALPSHVWATSTRAQRTKITRLQQLAAANSLTREAPDRSIVGDRLIGLIG